MKPDKTIGPVSNLENHLKPDWWKKIFNATYLKTDADVVEDARITAYEVALFHSILQPKEGAAVLDLACGQGRHLIELANYGQLKLVGLDRSRYLIHKARTTARKKGLNIQFKEGDARRLPFATDSFDVVTILGNSFGYFETAQDDEKILKEIFRVLKPEGKLLMDVADGGFLRAHFTPRSWEWIDKKHFVCRERSLAADNERLISREVVTNTEKGVIVDQFYAERLYSKEEISGAIARAGFKGLAFHGHIETDSLRNQDLGMMANRFILTAVALKEWTAKKTAQRAKNVLVVMGDPGLRDVIKPDAKFDSDDFDTIDRLKAALSKLPDYRFTYLNQHSSLIQDLQKVKPNTDLVFNLCDEGFDNDARKELHIPALLEMMGLPYTGSNPQTLAYCYDKSLIRGMAQELGVPVADAFVVTEEVNLFELNLAFPLIVKPNFGDSSFGITQKSVVSSVEEFADAIGWIREKFGYRSTILVEEFLSGAELSVGIIGNADQYRILPIIEEDFSELPDHLPKICGYEAKWLTDSPYMQTLRSIRATLPLEVEQEIMDHSLRLWQRLDCRDYARFDWRLDSQGQPKLLEVNPNPGWCWDGHLAKMCSIAGIDYTEMLGSVLAAAEARYASANAFVPTGV